MPDLVVQAGHLQMVNDFCFSPDTRFIASAGQDERIIIWDLRSALLYRTIPGSAGPVYAIDWHPTASIIASGHFDGLVKLWNPISGGLIRELDPLPDWVGFL